MFYGSFLILQNGSNGIARIPYHMLHVQHVHLKDVDFWVFFWIFNLLGSFLRSPRLFQDFWDHSIFSSWSASQTSFEMRPDLVWGRVMNNTFHHFFLDFLRSWNFSLGPYFYHSIRVGVRYSLCHIFARNHDSRPILVLSVCCLSAFRLLIWGICIYSEIWFQ